MTQERRSIHTKPGKERPCVSASAVTQVSPFMTHISVQHHNICFFNMNLYLHFKCVVSGHVFVTSLCLLNYDI